MRYLVLIALFFLMVSVGLSLQPSELITRWKRPTISGWIALTLVTFVVPPAIALILAWIFRLDYGETVGLFLLGVSPGAPLMTRNLGKSGYDIHLAASYQIWAALMIPIMLPLLVAAAARFGGRALWISPLVLLWQIVLKQLLPLGLGMLVAWFFPAFAERNRPLAGRIGNILFILALVLILYALGAELKHLTLFLPLAAILLAVSSVAIVLVVDIRDEAMRKTFAICNTNRNAGLALLLSAQYVGARDSAPTLVYYALFAPVVMLIYSRIVSKPTETSAIA
ncbi:bile acid:sodium symporter family protein [Candidatus Korobacter versatilis]|nr:hypothetical protein [Candidatus Koribacter versatilis]